MEPVERRRREWTRRPLASAVKEGARSTARFRGGAVRSAGASDAICSRRRSSRTGVHHPPVELDGTPESAQILWSLSSLPRVTGVVATARLSRERSRWRVQRAPERGGPTGIGWDVPLASGRRRRGRSFQAIGAARWSAQSHGTQRPVAGKQKRPRGAGHYGLRSGGAGRHGMRSCATRIPAAPNSRAS